MVNSECTRKDLCAYLGRDPTSVSVVPLAADPAIRRPAVIYSKDNAPATPRLEDLPLRESVSQYGITWTFARPARVGQFINGDWYVVGPATVAGSGQWLTRPGTGGSWAAPPNRRL